MVKIGYIDLSKRRVSAEDIVKCEERFNKGKMVASIMRHVAEKTKTPMENLYSEIGWPLNKKYGHAVDAFKLSISYNSHYMHLVVSILTSSRNPDIWQEVTFPSEVVKNELKSYIGKRLTPQPIKVRADVEVTCFGYEGIDAVKNALRAAEAQNTPETQVKVKLVSPPLYVLTSHCLEKSIGIATLEQAIKEIEDNIRRNGGGCVTKMAPKAVTENDDAELQELMERRERENQEVSGDESLSESDEGVPETM
jgi:translation initiation factor 2 subunit 1